MKESIFRKKSIDKVSSPEQLNDYIRVANPGVWLVLGALIIVLVGVCVWGIFGNLDTTLGAVGNCEDGVLTCYVSREEAERIEAGLKVTVDGKEYAVSSVAEKPVKVGALDEYLAYLGEFAADGWVYPITIETPELPNGNYEAEIVLDSVSPISFVLN